MKKATAKKTTGGKFIPIDPNIVEGMASVGATNQEIGDFVGCNGDTIGRRYADILLPLKQRRSEIRKQATRAKWKVLKLAAYHENPEPWKARTREWQARNKDRVRVIAARRRIKRQQVEGSHTAKDVALQMAAQKGTCLWCKVRVGARYHVDHITPISKGGTDWPGNICIACPECNMRKGAKLPSEFAGVFL